MVHGFLNLPLWGLIVATVVLTQLTVVSVTVYLHRHQAHRALDLHPVASHFFRFWLWLTTGMITREWVAVHRKHHANTETTDDPHSPQVLGLRKVLWEGTELYKRAAADTGTLAKYGHGTPDDWLERHVYSRHSMLGPTLMALIDLALFGAAGLTVWAVQMLWIPFWAAGVVNGVGHALGYRNFECRDAATNIIPWGVVVGGEELHNNHHAFPSSARFSQRRWELDPGWLVIRACQRLGLAQVRKLAPTPYLDPTRAGVEIDTVRAVVTNRLHVLRDYSKCVIDPMVRQEWPRIAALRPRRLKALLVRDRRLLDQLSQARLNGILRANARLATIYRYREALQAIWESRATSYEQLRQWLRQWCAQAEATGIDALAEFSARLRAYASPPPATLGNC